MIPSLTARVLWQELPQAVVRPAASIWRVRAKANLALDYWANRPRATSLLQGAVQTAQIHRLELGVDCLDADQTGAFRRSPAAFPLSRDTSRSSRPDRLPTLANTVNHSPDVGNEMGMASGAVLNRGGVS